MATTVSRDEAAGRYAIEVDGAPAGFTEFSVRDGVATFPHTEIAGGFEGRGLATRLIREALDDVRSRGLRVVARCPFVARFIADHADYQDLLA